MPRYEVEPVPGCEDEILAEYAALPVACADGFSAMMDILGDHEPSLKDRCGLIGDRHELYAIPLPDCARRMMIVSIDRRSRAMPRALHGTLPALGRVCDQGASQAIRQMGLINPSWET